MELAYFAAGCFWGPEEKFRKLPGVVRTAVGYCGGYLPSPTYEDVCHFSTGHAETVEVEFDPDVVSYEQLLEHFWKMHDPTQVKRQGPDIGDQYRSAIFCTNVEQMQKALASREAAQESFQRPLATEVTMLTQFWRAEDYHQQYYAKRGGTGCGI